MLLTTFASMILAQDAHLVPLESLDLTKMTIGWSEPKSKKSVDGHALKIAKQVFANGVGTHAESVFNLRLAKNATRFQAKVGVDDEATEQGSVRFLVIGDGKVLFNSGVMRSGDSAKTVDVSLKGVSLLTLKVDDADDGINYDHADWADATLTVLDAKKAIVPYVPPVDPAPKLAAIDLVHTQIHGPRVIGATPGKPFLFRVPASGKGQLKFKVEGLPAGIAANSKGNIWMGTAPAEGKYPVTITVTGPGGKASRTITIVTGKHQLALTPPMGWNSWNVWGTTVTADKVRASADAFEKLGLGDFGYQYVNIDDAWEGERDSSGVLHTNEKFGDMKALSDYVHSKGLKLGIYSSPGRLTCAGYAGSYLHEYQDAKSYGEWGIDYLKHDWCSYGEVYATLKNKDLSAYKNPYILMRSALDNSSRDIVYSLCQYGMGDVYEWGKDIGANLWRTTGDINDSWGSMSGIGFSHSRRSQFVKPGGWNDPDMLVVGRLGWGANPRPTKLTPNEQVTHITLWSLLAAPLIIGCDLTNVDEFTKRLLMNDQMIEIDQDPKGEAATMRHRDGETEVWARRLSDGSLAVGLFNRGLGKAKVSVDWDRDLKRGGSLSVYDIWAGKTVGKFSEGYSATVPSHGAVFLRVQ